MSDLNFILQRFSDNRKSTLGILLKITSLAKLLFQGYTLEDEFRPSKVKGETRIAANRYEIVIQTIETPKTLQYREKYSWFTNHLMLKDVPDFIGIYLHIGNDDKDTDGCILMGDNADNNVIGDGSISNSTQCFRRFYIEVYNHLKAGGRAFIDIRDEIKLL